MRHVGIAAVVTAGFVALSTHVVRADVHADEKARVEFAGALGKVVNLFGGKAAREGVQSTIIVKGDRKATLYEKTAKIIDLSEQKVYDLDLDKKTYKVTTFAQIRQQKEDERRKAEDQASKDEAKEQKQQTKAADKGEKPKEIQIDFDVKSTGQHKTLNGFDVKEAIMTITLREKGKTVEQSGGLIVTSDLWLAPKIAQLDEIPKFDQRYAEAIGDPVIDAASAQQMAAALAQYPELRPAMAKMRTEGTRMDGTPIQTTTTFDAVKSPEEMEREKQQQQQQQSDESASSPNEAVGKMFGRFARKVAKKKEGDDDQPKQRATFMTLNSEILKVVPSVSAADVAIPAGFKEK